ncbi:T-complex protein 10 C-terminus-domain-containing protein [Chytridium lagenaria]|nr:T-complex protein 10 C-terminus-domain-containing protein [Chytridium lagenaria]
MTVEDQELDACLSSWRSRSKQKLSDIEEFLHLEHLCMKDALSEEYASDLSSNASDINFDIPSSSRIKKKLVETGIQTDELGLSNIQNDAIEELQQQLREFQIAKASWTLKEQRLRSELEYCKTESNMHQDLIEKVKNLESELKQQKRINILLDKNKKASELLPSKRERAEMDILRKQMQDVSIEFKDAELRHSLTVDRLNKRIDMLKQNNEELKEEIGTLERSRANLIASAKNQPHVDTAPPDDARDSNERIASLALDDFQRRLGLKKESIAKEHFVSKTKFMRELSNKCKLWWYSNGTLKKVGTAGDTSMFYPNGDFLQLLSDRTSLYWYESHKTLQLTSPYGLQTILFKNGQVERRSPEGDHQVYFPNGQHRSVHLDLKDDIYAMKDSNLITEDMRYNPAEEP